MSHLRLLLVVLISVPPFFATSVKAVPLNRIWGQDVVNVRLCADTFSYHFGAGTVTDFINTTKNVIDTWNLYGGVNLRYNYAGEVTGWPTGCNPYDNAPNGEVYVRAEDNHPSGFLGLGPGVGSPITSGLVILYRKNGSLLPPRNFTWTFDSTTPGSFVYSVMLHELGHVTGFAILGDDPPVGSTPATVMTSPHSAVQRVLWQEDIMKLKDSSEQYHYNARTDRGLRFTFSSDAGLTWSTPVSFAQYTNSKLGLTANPSKPASQRFMVAWRGTNGLTTINTALMGTTSIDTSSLRYHESSPFGPTVAYSPSLGQYLLAYIDTADNRHIRFRTSTDGLSWSTASNLIYRTSIFDMVGSPYSSLWEPTATWHAYEGVFLLAWTEWRYQWDDQDLGRVRVCVSLAPAVVGFHDCVELPIVSNTTPGISCNLNSATCTIVWTEHLSGNGYRVCTQQGYVSAGFQLSGTPSCSSSITSRLAPSISYGSNYYLMSWRGNDSNGWLNTRRMNTFPTWTDARYPDYYVHSSGTTAFDPTSGVFAIGFIRR